MTQKHIFRYRQLAGEIETRIHSGTYQPGERLPSIRRLHKKLNLSISTVYQAYMELEAGGLIEARPKSGYYVSPIPLNRLQARITSYNVCYTKLLRKILFSEFLF